MSASLYADSGGSKTDWCYVDKFGNKDYFETESFHPNRFSPDFFARQRKFWNQKFPIDTELYFYGAGCSLDLNKHQVGSFFSELGFKIMEIESDLVGVCKAVFGEKEGDLIILGTGSVYAHWKNNAISQTIGGLGYLLGDEGSGFAAGREILKRLLSHQFSPELIQRLHKKIGSRAEIIAQVYGAGGKDFISSTARILTESTEIQWLHEENLISFIQTLKLQDVHWAKKTWVVGAYGFANQSILVKLLAAEGVKNPEFISKPIAILADSASI